jgi:G3E family GTPase
MQAQYTDLILLNKHELVTEREYDLVLDLVNDLNLDTGKLKWTRFLDPALFFGHDTLLFTDDNNKKIEDHHSREVDLISIKDDGSFTESEMDTLFSTMPKDQIYRVKGLFRMQNKFMVLNWAFGRWEWTETKKPIESTRITIMGIDLFEFIPKLKSTFQSVDFSPRKQY